VFFANVYQKLKVASTASQPLYRELRGWAFTRFWTRTWQSFLCSTLHFNNSAQLQSYYFVFPADLACGQRNVHSTHSRCHN